MKYVKILFLSIIVILLSVISFSTSNYVMDINITNANINIPKISYNVKHYQMNLDGNGYTLKDTETLSSLKGSSVSPNTKSYTGFTAPEKQTVIIDKNDIIIEYKYSRNKYYLNLNAIVGKDFYTSGKSGFTFDVTVNGEKVSTNALDYYTQHYYGNSYKIDNIKAPTGYSYAGLAPAGEYNSSTSDNGKSNIGNSSPITGTIGTGTTTVNLYFVPTEQTVTYEDWFVDSNNNRKVKLGSTTKKKTFGTTVNANELGAETAKSKYYTNYVYKTSTSATVGTNTTVYRYFWAWSNINVMNPEGTEKSDGSVAKFSIAYNSNTYATGKSNEESGSILPYGATIKIKDISMQKDYYELKDVTWGGSAVSPSNGAYTVTVTKAGNSFNVNTKYKTYTITYNLNGGSISGSHKTTYTYATDSFTLPAPSRANYLFKGWTGSNGTSPQPSVSIAKGSYGNKTYTANWQGNFKAATLRKFDANDGNVNYTFSTSTGEYSITQNGGSSGWGQGVICDDSTTEIKWGQTYMLEFEIYVPNTVDLLLDANVMYMDGSMPNGNDDYGTNYFIVDGVTKNGSTGETGESSHTFSITGGTWHKAQLYLKNNNGTKNPNHKSLKSFSGFGLNLTGKSTVNYKMRSLKSTVY